MKPPSGTVLIRGARQLLTLRGPGEPRRGSSLNELGIIRDGAVLIRDGVLVQVGPTRRVENLAAARGAMEINATGRVVMPGFVDSHTHLIHAPELSRNELEHASARAVDAVSAKRLEFNAREYIRAMARHGTTTLEAKTGYGVDETGELKILRALGGLNGAPLDIVTTFLGPSAPAVNGSGAASSCAELMAKIRKRKLARFADLPCPGPGPDYQAAFLAGARAVGFPIKIHADQHAYGGGVRVAVENGAVSADHLNYATREDVELLAASRTIATVTPGADFQRNGHRYAPARDLIDRGAAVALATNFNPHRGPSFSMQMAVALACAALRMTAAEAVSAATINGAHALECADRAGSLEPSKIADLIVLDAPDYRDLASCFGVNLVYLTMKAGRVIYRQGEVSSAAH